MNPQAPIVPETPKVYDPEQVVNEAESRVERDNHWITILSMAVFVLLALGAVVFLYYQNQQLKTILAGYQNQTPVPLATPTPTCKPRPACLDATPRCLIPETSDMCPPSPSPTPKACTMEAKLCPNGSYVGRTGPKCEFAPCPTP